MLVDRLSFLVEVCFVFIIQFLKVLCDHISIDSPQLSLQFLVQYFHGDLSFVVTVRKFGLRGQSVRIANVLRNRGFARPTNHRSAS